MATKKDTIVSKTIQSTLNFQPARTSKKRKQPETRVEQPFKLPKTNQDSNDLEQESTGTIGFKIDEAIGDLFGSAPKNAVLIHACNCQRSWGGGIAAAFKTRYPKAFQNHKQYCDPLVKSKTTDKLLGTAQLISPLDKPGHFIGCLFTSNRYGRAKDSPDEILAATEESMRALLTQINDWNQSHPNDEKVSTLFMCKINSGLFNVPWHKTRKLLEDLNVDMKDIEKTILVRDRT